SARMCPTRPANFAACPAPTNKPIRGWPGTVSRMKFRSAPVVTQPVLLNSQDVPAAAPSQPVGCGAADAADAQDDVLVGAVHRRPSHGLPHAPGLTASLSTGR